MVLALSGVGAPHVTARFDDRFTFEVDGAAARAIELWDDGTHGDSVAGDARYTATGLSPAGDGPIRSTSAALIQLESGGRTSKYIPLKLTLRAVDTLAVPVPPSYVPAPGMQATANVVAIVTPLGSPDEELVQAGRRYFGVFPDDRDFLFLLLTPRSLEWSGVSYGISAPFSGVGPVSLQSLDLGTRHLLRAPVFAVDPWIPTGDPEAGFCLPTHELLHTWAAYLPLGLSVGSHWSATLLRNRSGFGHAGACRFGPLELYLAGLLPPDSVTGALTATGTTIHDIVSAAGPRTPAWPDAPRHFTVATVVSTRAALSRAELAYYDFLAREYGKASSPLGVTFEAATEGRASLDTRVPAALHTTAPEGWPTARPPGGEAPAEGLPAPAGRGVAPPGQRGGRRPRALGRW
ncbi:MAG: hypothetical protein AMXMBFR53_35480 [Gemmatimonadota bacterium]